MKIPLYGYQRQFYDNYRTTDRMIWNKARQIGVSWVVGLAITEDAILNGTTWVVLSASEQQSREFMEKKIQKFVELFSIIAQYYNYEDIHDDMSFRIQEVQFNNGGRIFSVPANPRTARGYTGNLFLDEFAHHQDPNAIFQAAFPIVSRSGKKLWIASTPLGDSGKFHDIFTTNDRYIKYQTDVYQAAAQGCPIDPEQVKAEVGDNFIFDTEYMCKFVSAMNSFIPTELISKCEDINLPLELPIEELKTFRQGSLYAGFDVGRKRNKSSLWITERDAGRMTTRHVQALQNWKFKKQEDLLKEMLDKTPIRRLCIDATGLGMQIAENLQSRYGERIEPITFLNKPKEHLANSLKRQMEDGLWRQPHDTDIRYDFLSIRQEVTKTGAFRYSAEQNEKGHADHFWSAALANEAASGPKKTTEVHIYASSQTAGQRRYY
jgi:phage FluMu gp28-like protein